MHADHENMLLRKCLTCVGPLQAAPMQNLVLPASLARNAACSDRRQSMRLAKGDNKGNVCIVGQHDWCLAAQKLFWDIMFLLLNRGSMTQCVKGCTQVERTSHVRAGVKG